MRDPIQEHILIRAFAEVERASGRTSNASGVGGDDPRHRLAQLASACLEKAYHLRDPEAWVGGTLAALRVLGVAFALFSLAAGWQFISGYVFTGRSLPVFGLILILALALIPPVLLALWTLVGRLTGRARPSHDRRFALPRLFLGAGRWLRRTPRGPATAALASVFARLTGTWIRRRYERGVVCFWLGALLALVRPWWDTRIPDYEWTPAVGLRARLQAVEFCRFIPARFRPELAHIAYADREKRDLYYLGALPDPRLASTPEPYTFVQGDTPVTLRWNGEGSARLMDADGRARELPLTTLTAATWQETRVRILVHVKEGELPLDASDWVRRNHAPEDFATRWFAFINAIVLVGLGVRVGTFGLSVAAEKSTLRRLERELEDPPYPDYLRATQPAPPVEIAPGAPLVEAPARVAPTRAAEPARPLRDARPLRVAGYRRPGAGAAIPFDGEHLPWHAVLESEATRSAFVAAVRADPSADVCLVVDLSVAPEAEVGAFLRELHALTGVFLAVQHLRRFADQRGPEAAEARVRRWRDLLSGVGLPETAVSFHE